MKKTLATLLVVALVASLCGVMFVSAEETNVALGKSWTTDADDADAGSSYVGNVTDGVIEPDGKYDTSLWFGADRRKTDDDAFAMIFDLEETYDSLTKVNLHVWPANASGIVIPASIDVYVSADGETYTKVGSVTEFDGKAPQWVTVEFDAVAARYVKVDFVSSIEGDTGVFWFVSEIEIINSEAAADVAAPSITAKVLDGTLAYTEADLAKLIDGNDAAGATSFGDAGFVSFENKGFTHTDGVDAAVEATVELVLDLGAVKTLSNVTLSAFKDSNSMIALPTVKFYLSNDGENFYEINAGAAVAPADTLAETATASLSPSFSNRIAVNARYVKAVCTFKNGWLFLSELGVTLSDAEGEDLNGKYAYTDSFMEGYCIGVYHPEDGELDLSLNGDGKMLKSSQLIKAAYDAEAGAYKVIYSKVNSWPDGHTGTETLAEGEILVAISTQGNLGTDAFTGVKWIARGLVEGDYVVLDEENKLLSFYPASAFAAEEPSDPEQPDTPITGDTGILVFAVLAVVAVAGCAVASKIKSSAL